MSARLIFIACLLALPVPVQAAYYFWDFRNGHFDNLSLVPLGPGAVNLLKPTPEGLRISVPRGYDVKTVGFSPRFKISGDFEITMAFTVLKRSQPKTGFGSGPSLYVSMGTTQDPAASIGRVLRPDGQDHYGVFAARIDEGKRVTTARLFDVPAELPAVSGRLQLKRVGSEITYSAAEGVHSDLHPLVTLPLTESDVTLLRIGLVQSDRESSADMVLHDITITAADLPQLPSEQSRTAQLYRPSYQSPVLQASHRWLWQCAIAFLVTSGFAFWLWRRRSVQTF